MTDQSLDEKQKRLTGAARREAFLDAAAQLVLERGPAAVTMEGVAAHTGVNKRLAYRYFANREQLLHALIDRELDEVARRAALSPKRHATFDDRVRTDIKVWLAMTQERGPVLMKLRYGPDSPSSIGLERPVREWAANIEAGVGLPPQQAEIAARIFLAALRGAGDALERNLAPLDEVAALCATAALAGLHEVAARHRAQVSPDRKTPEIPCIQS